MKRFFIIIIVVFICLIVLKNRINNKLVVNVVSYKKPIISDIKYVVWDNLTANELLIKLNKNLYNELEGIGEYLVDYTIKTGLDPYLALAIINLETGCKWKCSYLVRDCYNIGGIKGKPSCNGSSYKRYNSLEEGVNRYLDLVYYGYYAKGLDTAKKMNKYYAANNNWYMEVNKYYDIIKEA